MRMHTAGQRPALRLLLTSTVLVTIIVIVSGVLMWLWTQAASMIELDGLMRLRVSEAATAMWNLLFHGDWSDPQSAFPPAERASAPAMWGYVLVGVCVSCMTAWLTIGGLRRVSRWRSGSPLGKAPGSLARRAVDRGWITQRTWAQPSDLHRLWITTPASGRPYLGYTQSRTHAGRHMIAAEPEVQPMIVAPPRTGKSSGFMVPWLLDHNGPALALSTKLDVYDATVSECQTRGRVWVYDPFGEMPSAGFSPLDPAITWSGALRTGEALASAAHPDQANAANEFWDKEAASMLGPLLHAAALINANMSEVVRWLDARSLQVPIEVLQQHDAEAAALQLQGVERRDERNRETTVMSALNLLRAYRFPEVAASAKSDLTPQAFLDGQPNTIYVVAAEQDQEALRPVILALISAIYHHAISLARRYGPLQPRLWMLLDEAANIAPIKTLGSWLSQCGDHGITIATLWQTIAQIDQRYGRPARDAICAASTAQLFLPPLADLTTTAYLSDLLGEEPVTNTSNTHGITQSLSVTHEKIGPSPWLRQIRAGQGILIYRDLPPAIVHTPGWYQDPRLAEHRALQAG